MQCPNSANSQFVCRLAILFGRKSLSRVICCRDSQKHFNPVSHQVYERESRLRAQPAFSFSWDTGSPLCLLSISLCHKVFECWWWAEKSVASPLFARQIFPSKVFGCPHRRTPVFPWCRRHRVSAGVLLRRLVLASMLHALVLPVSSYALRLIYRISRSFA